MLCVCVCTVRGDKESWSRSISGQLDMSCMWWRLFVYDVTKGIQEHSQAFLK